MILSASKPFIYLHRTLVAVWLLFCRFVFLHICVVLSRTLVSFVLHVSHVVPRLAGISFSLVFHGAGPLRPLLVTYLFRGSDAHVGLARGLRALLFTIPLFEGVLALLQSEFLCLAVCPRAVFLGRDDLLSECIRLPAWPRAMHLGASPGSFACLLGPCIGILAPLGPVRVPSPVCLAQCVGILAPLQPRCSLRPEVQLL